MPQFPAPNGELIVYIAALLILGIVALAADTGSAAQWTEVAGLVTAAYLISRGLAKLRNVREH
jgi:hypothetical protein